MVCVQIILLEGKKRGTECFRSGSIDRKDETRKRRSEYQYSSRSPLPLQTKIRSKGGIRAFHLDYVIEIVRTMIRVT